MTITSDSPEALDQVVQEIVAFAKDKKVWLFEGEMGAGKTTLIRAIGRVYHIEDMINSPTFSIVNEYQNEDGETFYHFDFYRVKDEMEALDIGCDEYFDSGNLCFIEWPSKIKNILPQGTFSIQIKVAGNTNRIIELSHND